MNKTKTPTADKKTFPLRLPPDIYRQVRNAVQKEKDKGNYAYSINDYLTEIIERELRKNRKKEKNNG